MILTVLSIATLIWTISSVPADDDIRKITYSGTQALNAFKLNGTAKINATEQSISLINNERDFKVGVAYIKEQLSIEHDFKISLYAYLNRFDKPSNGMAISFTESPIGTVGQTGQGFGDLRLKIRYNYSFEARMHQAPLQSQERFSELKNYLLSYEGVDVKKSWKYERFMYKGKPVLKAWIHGNNLKLYFNLEPKDLKDSKYVIDDVSYAKMHESTPSLFIVSGSRLLDYAKELVDMYLKDIVEKKDIPQKDYTVRYIKSDKLVEMKLVRVNKHK